MRKTDGSYDETVESINTHSGKIKLSNEDKQANSSRLRNSENKRIIKNQEFME
jgi:hypothetical protein